MCLKAGLTQEDDAVVTWAMELSGGQVEPLLQDILKDQKFPLADRLGPRVTPELRATLVEGIKPWQMVHFPLTLARHRAERREARALAEPLDTPEAAQSQRRRDQRRP